MLLLSTDQTLETIQLFVNIKLKLNFHQKPAPLQKLIM